MPTCKAVSRLVQRPERLGLDTALQRRHTITKGFVKVVRQSGALFRRHRQTLNIPVSSLALMFGRNSFRLDLISPNMPRALYFNDDVYVGFVQGGQYIEVASFDPKQARFSTRSSRNGARARFS
jgi:hypothetical protein